MDRIKDNPNPDLVWKGLRIIEFEDEEVIQVANIEKDKVIGTITFHRKDSGNVILFFVQVRDSKERLKSPQRVCINVSGSNNLDSNLRIPNEEEIKTINAIFKKVRNRVYGIEDKVSTPKKRELVRPKGWNNFDEE